jgi:hypothetical protein
VGLLGSGDAQAAETLAALQHDSSEAQALVREAGQVVVMPLQ